MRKLEYMAVKEDGKPFRVHGSELMREQLDALPPNQYVVGITAFHKKATTKQFGWLFNCIYPQMLIGLNNAGYEFTTVLEVDLFCKTMWANKELLNMETGQIISVPLSKAEFLTIDHMAYVDNIRRYALGYLGTTISDPDPNWKKRQKEVENLIKKQDERRS